LKRIWAAPIIVSILILGLIPFNEAFAVTEDTKLLVLDPDIGDQFGTSVSISGDTAIVGADFDDGVGIDSGSAYVFVRSGTTWIQQAKLIALDAAAFDQFGTSVSISGDTAIIGAAFDDGVGIDSGSAYVFVKPRVGWSGNSYHGVEL